MHLFKALTDNKKQESIAWVILGPSGQLCLKFQQIVFFQVNHHVWQRKSFVNLSAHHLNFALPVDVFHPRPPRLGVEADSDLHLLLFPSFDREDDIEVTFLYEALEVVLVIRSDGAKEFFRHRG